MDFTHFPEERKVDGHPNDRLASLVITLDTSTIGWGATYQSMRTRGCGQGRRQCLIEGNHCSSSLQSPHSIVDRQHNSNNYHKGGNHSWALSNITLDIWEWCLARDLLIHNTFYDVRMFVETYCPDSLSKQLIP